ncbi:unnamed protein product [Allacma fusca]|uniref:Uncharacterized protein n=1 Tax=Allacma fusca TaxID=39272 RepID=A0A8J2JFL2_9HEXA|nr:unnamed protein product [Allacma fusca]
MMNIIDFVAIVPYFKQFLTALLPSNMSSQMQYTLRSKKLTKTPYSHPSQMNFIRGGGGGGHNDHKWLWLQRRDGWLLNVYNPEHVKMCPFLPGNGIHPDAPEVYYGTLREGSVYDILIPGSSLSFFKSSQKSRSTK